MDPQLLTSVVALVGGGGMLAAFVTYGIQRDKRARRHQATLQKNLQDAAAPLLAQISQGQLPVMATKALLKKNEIAHFACRASLLEMQTTHYEGGGASVRIAKGINVGGGRKRAVKGLVAVANGELTLTNQRVIFSGTMKSFECKLTNLTHVEPLTDGLIFHYGAKAQKIQITQPITIKVARATLDLLLQRQHD